MSIAFWARAWRRSAVWAVSAVAATVMLPADAGAQAPSTGGREVTFTKDVAPILQRSCVTCHRVGEMAPMSLMTFDEVRPWARAIKQRVVAREMPPWHIDRNLGILKFKDDPSLSDGEIATIATWVDSGAPQGDPRDMPPPRQFADSSRWGIGEPDLVVKFPTYTVPATGPDLYGDLFVASDLTEDRHIKAVQTRPVGPRTRRVLHHSFASHVDAPSGADSLGGDEQFLVEYASGKNGEIYPDDSGILLPAGGTMRLAYHLHSVGEDVPADIEVGFVFHPKGTVPKHTRWSRQLGQPTVELDIPANTIVRRDGYTFLKNAARITAFQPHMHIRGRYQCLELIYPTAGSSARSEVVNCAHFNYSWHLVYNYADDSAPLVPAGTMLHLISWYDNTAGNRGNPDPNNWVGNGQRTIDEMSFAWIGWYDLTDEEYEQEVEARKARQPRPTNNQP